MKKNKILIVTEYFYPEEFKINEIAIAWKEKGYEVDVLTQNPTYPLGKVFEEYENKWYSRDRYNDMNIYRVKAVTGYKENLFKKLLKYILFMFLGSVIALFIGRKYDYIFGFNMAALTGMVPAIIIKKIYKKPLMFWAQDIWPDSVYAYGFKKTKLLSFSLDWFVKKMYHNITSLAISGKGFELRLNPYLPNNLKCHYLPNWADDLDMSLEAFKFSEEKKTHFTFAGNVGKVQNLENIIHAFISLPLKYQEKAQLNIIGDGSNLEKIKNISDNKYIVFHGKKPREEMAKYYKSSDFLIVSLINKPIFSVTVPAKTQTYVAAKKPIFAVINGDTSDIVKENKLGFCSNPSDIDDIKKGFINCINTDEETRKEFVKQSEYLLQTTFNKERIINDMTDILIGNK